MADTQAIAPEANAGATQTKGANSTATAAASSKPWISLFPQNRNSDKGLKLQHFVSEDKVVVLRDNDLYSTEEAWGICLVGYVVGKFPGTCVVEKVCDAWGVTYKYYTHQSGWMVFKFESHEDREKVMLNGPYFCLGRPWVLKYMPRFFTFDDTCVDLIPTWITLPGLPLECWNPSALGKIASMIGVPVVMDLFTQDRSHPAYARILVEVDASKPLRRTVPIRIGAKIIQQVVNFEFQPKFCVQCHRIGHINAECKGKQNEEQASMLTSGSSKSRRKKRKMQSQTQPSINNPESTLDKPSCPAGSVLLRNSVENAAPKSEVVENAAPPTETDTTAQPAPETIQKNQLPCISWK